jgi:hypothetical protein
MKIPKKTKINPKLKANNKTMVNRHMDKKKKQQILKKKKI